MLSTARFSISVGLAFQCNFCSTAHFYPETCTGIHIYFSKNLPLKMLLHATNKIIKVIHTLTKTIKVITSTWLIGSWFCKIPILSYYFLGELRGLYFAMPVVFAYSRISQTWYQKLISALVRKLTYAWSSIQVAYSFSCANKLDFSPYSENAYKLCNLYLRNVCTPLSASTLIFQFN